ncbi:MAG: PEP-CTERM sorting domain-containing protein [Alphaproteobacteria bacterium]|jgi:hypothetical protein|nr:PEP-CTERM sorting domain-containing protein [Alphaproteobacteria bacterium]MDP6564007.1 PEP-CTERM sorting domain-containing protein [Alphaproteobacteria bacterium]MDP6814150.1 PEP-CTERM sorting domain-containing protein [Alphaproteobacteria bacterium]
MMSTHHLRACATTAAVIGALLLGGNDARALTFGLDFSGSYTDFDLGGPSGVPGPLGGLTFKAGDPNTLLIGGNANSTAADIYQIGLTRDINGHINGFTGPATFFADAYGSTGGIDGGLRYGPGGVLFYTSYGDNHIGQIKPGSTAPDKLVDLNPLGIGSSVGSLEFVPAGFAGAGKLKLVSYNTGQWYDATLTPDGFGTYDVSAPILRATLGGGPEGIVYIEAGNAGFGVDSVLVSEYGNGKVAAYEIDANGDPITSTRRDFITDLSNAEGALIDPLTGDFLFSTFGGGDRVVVIQGFVPPTNVIPEPGTLILFLLGLGGFGVMRRRLIT